METSNAQQLLSDELRLVQILPQHLPQVWPVIEPLLKRACDRTNGEITLNDVLANLEHWPILVLANGTEPQAIMVTSVVIRGDGKKVLNCILASGRDADQWPQADDQLDAFARSLGCERVRIPCGRKGWAKRLPHWQLVGYVMERDI